MEHANEREVRSYPLPRVFWVALLEVRNYWIQEERFVDSIYGPDSRDKSLRRAFDLMDDYLSAALESEVDNLM